MCDMDVHGVCRWILLLSCSIPCTMYHDDCSWTAWGQCSASCGGTGSRVKTYTCCNFDHPLEPGDVWGCMDDNQEIETCSRANGNWGTWEGWTSCSVTCGYGEKTRQRVCNDPLPSSGCSCIGSDMNTVQCYIEPVHGGWGPWSTLSSCSQSCGTGSQTRTRICNNPVPARCGDTCQGGSIQTQSCNTQDCPDVFYWWTNWDACSASCGSTGTRRRSYMRCDANEFNSPDQVCGTELYSQEEPCATVNGNWGLWGGWSPCSVTCGSGYISRYRECNNPSPSNGCADCIGSNTDSQICDRPPVHGGWATWSRASSCSKSCGGGILSRSRLCDSPTPARCGNPCSGETSDTHSCNTHCCPVDGNWGLWGGWSACSVTCGKGTRQKDRACKNPAPACGGSECLGNNYEASECSINPVHGGWGTWNQASSCSKSCGGGTLTRSRLCNSPVPERCGNLCSGESSDTYSCNTNCCAIDGNWGLWSGWSGCSVTCGKGNRERDRACNNPAPACGGHECVGNHNELLGCSIGQVHGGWGEWSQYSTCSGPGNVGSQTRSRECNNPHPANCGNICSGERTQTANCSIQGCPDNSTINTPRPMISRSADADNGNEMSTSTTSTLVSSSAINVSSETVGITNDPNPNTDTAKPAVVTPSSVPENLQIIKVWPTYGPKAGGTLVTIHGYRLSAVSDVKLGNDFSCKTIHSNETVLLVITPRLERSDMQMLEHKLQIIIVTGSTLVVSTPFGFVYKEDPIIESVYPTEMIKQGGTNLTVLGFNLDSVAGITMLITMVFKELVEESPRIYNMTVTNYETVCTTMNSTQALCPTPHIYLPAGFVGNKYERHYSKYKPRSKRSLKLDYSHNGDMLEFYIGFNLDGVEDYKNYSTIDVFVEPEFSLNTGIQNYKPGDTIQFQGEHLDSGITVNDYSITVEREICGNITLLSNMLSCLPPGIQPDIEKANEMGHPIIVIHVGLNLKHMAGYLRYPEASVYSGNTLPLYVIILAAVLPTCAVVIIIVAVICIKKRQRQA